jgi:hypothetical protein
VGLFFRLVEVDGCGGVIHGIDPLSLARNRQSAAEVGRGTRQRCSTLPFAHSVKSVLNTSACIKRDVLTLADL